MYDVVTCVIKHLNQFCRRAYGCNAVTSAADIQYKSLFDLLAINIPQLPLSAFDNLSAR